MLEPASHDARLIKDLYDVIFYIAVGVFLLVEILLIYAAAKFRRKSANEMPVQVHGNTNMELLWTIVPAIVIAIMFFMTLNTMDRMSAAGAAGSPIARTHAIGDLVAEKRVKEAQPVDLAIEVTGRQWFWIFNYNSGELTTDTNRGEPLIIPANKNIRLDMTSGDVIHAWYMPQFGPMRYVNPGEKSYVFFNVPPGDYMGQCNVYCGLRHAYMLSHIRALPEEEYNKWYAEQTGAANATAGPGDPARGKEIFTNTGPCKACHFIEGTTAQGRVAPREMTHFAGYPTIAQVEGFANNPENLAKWLKDPQSIKKGTAMPNNNLKPQEIADLVAFLETLK